MKRIEKGKFGNFNFFYNLRCQIVNLVELQIKISQVQCSDETPALTVLQQGVPIGGMERPRKQNAKKKKNVFNCCSTPKSFSLFWAKSALYFVLFLLAIGTQVGYGRPLSLFFNVQTSLFRDPLYHLFTNECFCTATF